MQLTPNASHTVHALGKSLRQGLRSSHAVSADQPSPSQRCVKFALSMHTSPSRSHCEQLPGMILRHFRRGFLLGQFEMFSFKAKPIRNPSLHFCLAGLFLPFEAQVLTQWCKLDLASWNTVLTVVAWFGSCALNLFRYALFALHFPPHVYQTPNLIWRSSCFFLHTCTPIHHFRLF